MKNKHNKYLRIYVTFIIKIHNDKTQTFFYRQTDDKRWPSTYKVSFTDSTVVEFGPAKSNEKLTKMFSKCKKFLKHR